MARGYLDNVFGHESREDRASGRRASPSSAAASDGALSGHRTRSEPVSTILSWCRENRRRHGMADLFFGMVNAGMPPFKTDEEALAWLSSHKEERDPSAIALLGWMFEEGLGAPRRIERAVELYTEAASLGQPEAQYRLGLCLH